MNISKILLLSVLLIIWSQSRAHYTESVTRVGEITTSDELLGALQAKKRTVIKLYSQNCPHCNMLAKPFADAASKYKNTDFLEADGKKLNAPKIVGDFTKNSFKVPGYPTILYIKNGALVDHQIGGNPKILEEKIQKNQK